MFDDAQNMLDTLCRSGALKAHGAIGLFPAYSDGDDVMVLNEKKTDIIATFYGLRQQVRMSINLWIPISFTVMVAKGRGMLPLVFLVCCLEKPFMYVCVL